MKTHLSIMTWINRIIIIPFLLCLFLGIIEIAFFYYAAYIAFAIGVFHIFSSLLTLFYINKIEKKMKSLTLIYIASVALYFISLFIIIEYYINKQSIVNIVLYSIPVILSLFWSYILESIKSEL